MQEAEAKARREGDKIYVQCEGKPHEIITLISALMESVKKRLGIPKPLLCLILGGKGLDETH